MRQSFLFLPAVLRRRLRRPGAYAICGVVLASATGLLTYRLLDVAVDGAARYGEPIDVAIATVDLRAGTTIGRSDVEVRSLPRSAVPPTALRTASIGRAVRQAVSRGEVLVAADLSDPGSSATAAALPPGTVALAVPRGIAALPLTEGDRVDLIEVATDGGSDQGVLTRDAVVVGVEEETVTVAVGADRASRVAAAVVSGTVVPVLRSSA